MQADREFARGLRKNSTDAERKLWSRLRDRRLDGIKFRRQVMFGRFVADFCCIDAKLIIELDGGQHAEREAQDEERTKGLQTAGYEVIRFWNNEVMTNINGVLDAILSNVVAASRRAPHQ